jgi:drug/metabolite transporter (DMT)-like permease
MKTWMLHLLVFGMLFTGTINTLLNKLQDLTCVGNCDSDEKQYFAQPLLQTLNMFIGEILCLAVFYINQLWNRYHKSGYEPITIDPQSAPISRSNEHIDDDELLLDGDQLLFNVEQELTGHLSFWFLIPTILDLLATTMMNIGLILISASIYQMLRGSVVLFTAIFSTIWLRARHSRVKWIALILVFAGVAIVGSSTLLVDGDAKTEHVQNSPWGILFVVLAQAFTATQFVVEEKIMSKYVVSPTKAVGLEGFFGLTLTMLALPILHFTLGVQSPDSVFNIHQV